MIKIYTGISILCFAVWLLLSGYFTNVLLLALGAASCVFVICLAQRMRLLDEDLPSVGFIVRFFAYIPWLIIEIGKSNVDVIKRILNPQLPISPTLFRVEASQKTDLARVIFANSITLTPGTVAIRVEDNHIEVHALSQEGAHGLSEGTMNQRVSRLENH